MCWFNILRRIPDSTCGSLFAITDAASRLTYFPASSTRIFDPYFTTKTGCIGLGLTSSYSIINKHGGVISVQSQPGHGTLLVIDLVASMTSPAAAPPAIPVVPTGPWKILVMDDEEGIRKLLQSLLTAVGYEVMCTAEGAEAIAMYEAASASGRAFDAVLLDLTVKGGMGGIDTASRIRETHADAKLIVSSGYSDSPVLSRFHEYGFDDMIAKTVDARSDS